MSSVKWIVLFVLLPCFLETQGQCPTVDFNIPASACINQNILTTNLSGAGSYSWDFCTGEFNASPTGTDAYSVNGSNGRPAVEFAFDGSKWFGFITGTFSNQLVRLEYSNGLSAAPTFIENLGDLSGKLNGPSQIRIFQESSTWYGVLYNTNTTELLLLNFGNKLSNTITASVLTTGVGSASSGLAIGKDVTNGWVCMVTTTSNELMMIRLGSSITPPGSSDKLTTTAISGGNNLGDVDLINVCGNWYGFASNFGNGSVYRMSFGNNLFSNPVVDQLTSLSESNLGRLRIVKDGEQFFLLVVSFGGNFYKFSFGASITSSPSITNEGTVGGVLQSGAYGLAVGKENSVWTVAEVNASNGHVYNINYANSCSASPKTSTLSNPVVYYSQNGSFNISLDYSTSTATSTKTRSITVSSSVAPDIDFTSINNCANNNVNFTEINVSGNISTRAWNFGDSQSSSALNPSHVYASAGTYQPKITVTASNGCQNFQTKSITIYNQPIANFNLPSASTICTNQNYALTNTSTFDAPSNPTWEWRLNGTLISNQKDISTSFSSTNPQQIKLKAIIAGCENEVTKNITTLTPGPLVAFSAQDNCQGSSVAFDNTTSGTVTGFTWDFGDGGTSTQSNVSHTYATPGTFQTTLTASNAAGCQNSSTKAIKIYSLPVPDFSINLPPFSCNNSLTPFQNNTPSLTDSNINLWSWKFGDTAGGTSNQQAPSYTYTTPGNYSVTLTATSDAGCSAFATKNILISPSPVADFTSTPTCLNTATQFTDLSSGGVQSRQWQIGSSSFTTTNPAYTFTSTGNFNAVLTVTGTNSCANVKSKVVTVPVLPVQNFTITNSCSNQDAVFTDATTSPTDLVTGWNWNFSGNSATGNPVNYAFDAAGTYNVKFTTTHTSGCRYTLSKDVTINSSPIASFVATPDRGAAPLIVQFTNTSQRASTYAWKFNDKVVATSTATSPSYTFTALGDYSAELTATSSLGCSDVFSLPIKVLVPSMDLIMKDFSLTPDGTTGNLKGVVTILNNSNIPITTAVVALYLSDKAVVNETLSLNLSPGQSAIKTLSFSLSPTQFNVNFLCAVVLSEKDIQPDNNKRCLNLETPDYFFSPYPNPTSGTLHVDWISQRAGAARIVVYDNLGKKSFECVLSQQIGLNQGLLDLSFLTAGLYYVSVETDAGRKTTRFLRQ